MGLPPNNLPIHRDQRHLQFYMNKTTEKMVQNLLKSINTNVLVDKAIASLKEQL